MLKRRSFYIALRGNSVRERLIGSLKIYGMNSYRPTMSTLREDSSRDVYDLSNNQLAYMPMTTFVCEHVLLVGRANPNIGYLFAVRARARTCGLP